MILCCGEALIDMIPTPVVTGGDGFVPHAGGAIFNTAIALGRLGVETGMLEKSVLKTLSAQALAQALGHGARVAAVTVSRAGASPSWAADL